MRLIAHKNTKNNINTFVSLLFLQFNLSFWNNGKFYPI